METKNQLAEAERKKLVELSSKTIWSDDGKEALAYLKEQRGLSESSIKEFQIGYVPLRVNHLCSGRLIFPIFDPYGKLVAVSTRHLHKKKTDIGYFWHESFDKSFYLYGLHIAKNHIFKCRKAILVEGEIDVLSMHSHGLSITVGVCGSAFRSYQAAILNRYCDELYIMLDGDKSGKDALNRAFEMKETFGIENLGLKFIPCRLPNKVDPDDFVRQGGKKAVIQFMKTAKEEFELMGYHGN